MSTLIVDKIPEDLKNNFRAECVRRGIPMREVIMRLMALELDENFSSVLTYEKKLVYTDKMIRNKDMRTK